MKLTNVSRLICRVGNVTVYIKILIPDDKPIVAKRMWEDNYTTEFNIPSFLTLDLLLPFDGMSRRRSGSITLTEVGKVEFLALARKVLKIIHTEKVFYTDPDNGLSVYKNLGSDGISLFQVAGKVGNDYVALHPDVFIEEDNHIETQGVRITASKSGASIVVTYTDMLILVEVLKDINISVLSQLLYLSCKNEIEAQPSRSPSERERDFKTHARLDELLSKTESTMEGFKNVKREENG